MRGICRLLFRAHHCQISLDQIITVAAFARDKNKGDVLLEFSSVKWDLNEDHTLYCNVLGTLLLQNFVLVNSYFNEFFVAQAVFDIIGIRFM